MEHWKYDIDKVLNERKRMIPNQFKNYQPIEEDYWGKLIIKGHNNPEQLSNAEIFELGVYCERMFQNAPDDLIKVQHILAYRRTLNAFFERNKSKIISDEK